MRIISQDGTLDLPYNSTSLYLAELHETGGTCCGYIICGHSSQLQKSQKVAEYKTKEKAEKAMELLRQAYAGVYITNAEVSEDFDKTMQELMKHGFGTVIVRDVGDSRVEFDNLNGYFKFPSDEKIEV